MPTSSRPPTSSRVNSYTTSNNTLTANNSITPSVPPLSPTSSARQAEAELAALESDLSFTRTMVQTAESQTLWWKHWRSMTWKEFTTFPNPVNESEVRIWIFWAFLGCLAGVLLDIYCGSPVMYWVTMGLAFLRATFGFRLGNVFAFLFRSSLHNTVCLLTCSLFYFYFFLYRPIKLHQHLLP